MYPLTEIWLLIRENEEHEQERNKYSTNTENVTRGRVFHLCKRVGFPNANVLYYRSPSNNASAFYFGFLWFSRVFVFQDHDHTPEPKRQSEEKKADREKKPGKKDSSSEDSTRKLSLTPSEIESVVAHELGHWYNGDSGASLILWHFRVISTCILVYYIRSSQTVHKIFLLAPAENNTGVELLPGAFVAYFFILRPYYKANSKTESSMQLYFQKLKLPHFDSFHPDPWGIMPIAYPTDRNPCRQIRCKQTWIQKELCESPNKNHFKATNHVSFSRLLLSALLPQPSIPCPKIARPRSRPTPTT